MDDESDAKQASPGALPDRVLVRDSVRDSRFRRRSRSRLAMHVMSIRNHACKIRRANANFAQATENTVE